MTSNICDNADRVLIPNNFYVEHKNTRNHHMDRPHYHDGFEIHYSLHDNTDYYVDDRHYHFNSGTVVVYNSQEIHRVVVEQGVDYERFYLLFKPEFIEFVLSDYPDLLTIFYKRPKNFINCLQLTLSKQRTIVKLLDQLVCIYQENNLFLHEIKLKQKFIELLIFLNECYLSRDDFISEKDSIQNELLTRATKYIKDNISRNLTLDNIADEFYTSKSTLIRVFKDHMGLTPFRFITYTRIMKSREMVLQGIPISEVAFRVGYRDDSSFIKKFKQLQGVSPKQYLLINQKKKI